LLGSFGSGRVGGIMGWSLFLGVGGVSWGSSTGGLSSGCCFSNFFFSFHSWANL
jgi:hypothetical protein